MQRGRGAFVELGLLDSVVAGARVGGGGRRERVMGRGDVGGLLIAKSWSLRYRHLRSRHLCPDVYIHLKLTGSARPYYRGGCSAVAHVLGWAPLTVARHQMSWMRRRTRQALALLS